MKWFISFFKRQGEDYLFKTEHYAFFILEKQIATLKNMGIAEKDVVVLSNVEEKVYHKFKGIEWKQLTIITPDVVEIYHIASVIDSKENEIAIWNTHYPLLESKDFYAAIEGWDHTGLLGAIERLKRHPYYLLEELDSQTIEIDFWLGRGLFEKEINGRQDLNTIFHLSGAFLFANLDYRTDYLKAALSARIQYYVIPETKVFSLERSSAESCCVDEIVNTPKFYQQMGDSFNIKILEEMYPECKVIAENE